MIAPNNYAFADFQAWAHGLHEGMAPSAKRNLGETAPSSEKHDASRAVTDDKLILVVEDDEDSRESLREFLQYHGYKVNCAENGQAALEQIETAEISPTLILLDLSMPAMDGWAFLRCIRERSDLQDVSIVVISGDVSSAPISDTAAVLAKPVDPEKLLSLVKCLCASRPNSKEDSWVLSHCEMEQMNNERLRERIGFHQKDNFAPDDPKPGNPPPITDPQPGEPEPADPAPERRDPDPSERPSRKDCSWNDRNQG